MKTNFLVQHNLPLSIADDQGQLFRNILSDRQIANTYASGRTKTTCILNNAIAPHFNLQVSIIVPIVTMQFPFTFPCGSNVKCYVFCFILCIFNYLKFITWQWYK